MQHFHVILVLALLAILPGCSTSSVPLVSKPLKAVFLGDSVVAGEGVGAVSAYPALFKEKHATLEVLNQGRPGWSAKSYIKRNTEIWSRLPMDADLIFVQLGLYDLREGEHKPESVQNAARNINDLLQFLKRHSPDATLVLLSPTQVFPSQLSPALLRAGFGSATPELLRSLERELQGVAKQNRVRYIPLLDLLAAEETIDGVHPTAEGHRKLANHLWKEMRSRLVIKSL